MKWSSSTKGCSEVAGSNVSKMDRKELALLGKLPYSVRQTLKQTGKQLILSGRFINRDSELRRPQQRPFSEPEPFAAITVNYLTIGALRILLTYISVCNLSPINWDRAKSKCIQI